jgi:hypothetical protein
MFDFLLKPFSPLTAFYNSLVVVNCVFQHFEIKRFSYDPFQTDQIVTNYKYNPFAGKDNDDEINRSLVMNNIEEDYMAVDKLMEVVDDDYCLTHLVDKFAATDADIASTTTTTTATATTATTNNTPAQLVGCIRIFFANVIENIACSFIFGAILSCDFILTEKKSIEDFVNVKSEEIKNSHIVRCRPKYGYSSSSEPKMRGFGVDFGVPGFKYVNFATVPDTDFAVPEFDFAAVPVYSNWKKHIGNEVICRRESYIRYNREHEDIDGWGFVENDFSIQAEN